MASLATLPRPATFPWFQTLWWIGLACALVALPTPCGAGVRLEYWTVEANEGGSSGGHAAIAFDDRVYHFQYQGGLVRLMRDESFSFLESYALESNRTVHTSRLDVSEGTWDLLLAAFGRLHRAQSAQLDLAAAAREDRELLELLLRARGGGAGEAGLRLKGAGFFRSGAQGSPSAALLALRERVARRHGPDHLSLRVRELQRELARLEPDSGTGPPPEFSRAVAPGAVYSFARRYRDGMTALAALEVLREARPLRPGVTRVLSGTALRLEPRERRQLDTLAAGLEVELVRLVASERPDWGFALLVGMARLAALDESRRSGRLVVLDAFSDAPGRVATLRLGTRSSVQRQLLGQAREDLAAARARLSESAAPGERVLSQLEEAANRYVELESAIREVRALRIQAGRLVPVRSARRLDLVQPAGDVAGLANALTRARARERALAHSLDRLYGYNLVTRNCVSEIFRTVDDALGQSREASRRRLGGHIAPLGSLHFVPWISQAAVRKHYRVSGAGLVPSLREARLAQMYERENPVLVYLRESNTLTSRAYRRGADDSFFLLFTDGALVPRPIFGAVNLVAALGETVLGLIWSPADRGRTLLSGIKGVLGSLPELAFVNIRKGSNDYVSREDRAALRVAWTVPRVEPMSVNPAD